MTSKLKAVFVDLDNTLVDTDDASCQADSVAAEFLTGEKGVPNSKIVVETFRSLLRQSPSDPKSRLNENEYRSNHWKTALESSIDDEKRLPIVAREVYEVWRRARLEHLVPPREILDVLVRLRKEGYKLLLLTNGPSIVQWEKIRATGVSPYFDSVVVSGDCRWEKPDARIFEHSLRLVGVDACECVMVGDSLETDIRGGINAGLAGTVWKTRKGNDTYNQYVIGSLLELPGVLKQIERDTI